MNSTLKASELTSIGYQTFSPEWAGRSNASREHRTQLGEEYVGRKASQIENCIPVD